MTVDLSQLTCSTITLTAGQISVPVDNLTIDGPGSDNLTIDGNTHGRVFYHTGSGALTIRALTIADGSFSGTMAYGGCIRSANGSVSLIDATVSGCKALAVMPPMSVANGGGINGEHGVQLLRTTIANCQAISYQHGFGLALDIANGGGVFSRQGPVVVTDSVITNNRAQATYSGYISSNQSTGGGIAAYRGATISDSVISNNFAGCNSATQDCLRAAGGGLRVIHDLTVSSSSVYGNVIESSSGAPNVLNGGGIEATQATPGIPFTIQDSTIKGNRAQGTATDRRGGGVELVGTTLISGSTIVGNIAGEGGGIEVGGQTTIVASTVSGNSASGPGGAIYLPTSALAPLASLTLEGSTVTLNTSTGSSGGAGIVDNHNPANPVTDFQSSIVAGNSNTVEGAPLDADVASADTNDRVITGANNLIIAASGMTLPPDTLQVDPLLGPLQDNGGPTWTHALLPGSPAIDTGNNVANLSWDQRGDGYPRVVGVSADIGAFEYLAGVNQTPVAVNDSYTTAENTALTVDAPGVLGNDTDPDGDSLTAILVSGPSNGAVTLNSDGSFVYVPAVGFSGTDSFTYEANDGQLNSNVATVTIKVSHVDQPPVAENDSYTIAENTALTVNAPGVLGNDSDPDGDSLTAILVSGPSNGVLTMNTDGSFVYVPAAGFSGTDSFTYEADDGQLNSNVATVTIKVSNVDQPPVAANDSYTAVENTTLKVSAPGVLGNDTDPDGDSLTAILVSGPSNGALTLNTDGSFVYVPAVGFSGTASFTYEANDGQLNSNVATVTIKISNVDQPPVAANDSYTAAEDTTLKVSAPGVLGNDSDADGDTLSAVLLGPPSNGTLAMNPDGSFIYVPTAGFSGKDSFTYEANDGQLNSNIATVTIKVGQFDQPPVAANDSYTTAENTTLTISSPGVLGNDSDPNGDTLTAVLMSTPSNGTFAMNPDGSFIYVPAVGFFGTDSFTYQASDGQLDSNVATVTVTITESSDDMIFSDGFDGP